MDWHYVVYHELIESSATAKKDVIIHPSAERTQRDKQVPTISLSSCFDKFMEEEKLDGIVCPKCKSDEHLKKSFVLWRLPPVLMIQLKRFQFDRFSRRKLNDLVQFPLENLDVAPYLASCSPHHPPPPSVCETWNEDKESIQLNNEDKETSPSAVNADILSSRYNMYAAVHHVGLMGGGHYVASIRDNSANLKAMHNSSSSTSEKASGGEISHSESFASVNEFGTHGSGASASPSVNPVPLSKQWWCFNDSTVTPMKQEEVVVPSAYLLFYMRDDIFRGGHRVEDIFKCDTPYTGIDIDERDRHSDSTVQSRGVAKNAEGEDVSKRRNYSTDDGGSSSEQQKDGSASRTFSNDSNSDTNATTGGASNDTNNRKRINNSTESTSSGKSGEKITGRKNTGYTEEEFEKIMKDSNSQNNNCRVS